jgi:hypothetical protein
VKIVVYSAITGAIDNPRTDGIQCFGDYARFQDPRLNAKIYKVLSHQFVDADVSVWVDGNVQLLVSPEELVSLMSGDACAFRHWDRDCIYDEARVCIRSRLDNADTIRQQMDKYQREGFPKHAGLAAASVLMRRHTPEVCRMNERWWAEICTHSIRDQLSLPVCFRGSLELLDVDPRGRYIQIARHSKPRTRYR